MMFDNKCICISLYIIYIRNYIRMYVFDNPSAEPNKLQLIIGVSMLPSYCPRWAEQKELS